LNFFDHRSALNPHEAPGDTPQPGRRRRRGERLDKPMVGSIEAVLGYATSVALLMLSLAAPVLAGPLEDAVAADDKGDYATALPLLRQLA